MDWWCRCIVNENICQKFRVRSPTERRTSKTKRGGVLWNANILFGSILVQSTDIYEC